MVINANTKIGSIFRERADALEAIISISPKFEKLRNPILRKLMAARTSIATASRIGDCSVEDFFSKLRPLGFEVDNSIVSNGNERTELPLFMKELQQDQVTELDVRPFLSAGDDPLPIIVQKIKSLKQGWVLKIVNSFYPEPLIHLLEKQGYEAYVESIAEDLVETYFYKKGDLSGAEGELVVDAADNWENIFKKYSDSIQVIDVRHLAMPRPMITILEALDRLPAGTALFVYHKRIPLYLLPELKDRHFSYLIKEISEGEVNLLIFQK